MAAGGTHNALWIYSVPFNANMGSGQKIVEVVGATTLAKTDADHDNQVLKLIEARQPLKDEELAVPNSSDFYASEQKKNKSLTAYAGCGIVSYSEDGMGGD